MNGTTIFLFVYQITDVKRLLDGFVPLLPERHVVAPPVAGSVVVVPEKSDIYLLAEDDCRTKP